VAVLTLNFAVQWRLPESDLSAFSAMVDKVKACDASTLHGVGKSFAHFLALANTAENNHRIRKLRATLVKGDVEFGLWPQRDSCVGSIEDLLQHKGIAVDQVMNALKTQTVEIVLTAHPTEVNRRTMLYKLLQVRELLQQLDNTSLTKYELKRTHQLLQSEIAAIWGSDSLRRSKPSAVDEARAGLLVVENVLWKAIPNFLRKLDDATRTLLNQPLPLELAPIRIATWMGGDRDGTALKQLQD
jgi:phosphoenolpyruvate carboxylase